MSGNTMSKADKLLASGGTVAWAKVLEAREKWQSMAPGLASMTVVSHMHVELRVEPDSEPPFEAKFGQPFSSTVPLTGGICKVVYDPRDHSRISVIDGSCAPPGTAAPTSSPHVADQLTQLADLKDRGVLTDAEFAAQKAKLLSEI